MAHGTNPPVVVGVDGTDHSDRAVRYAIAESRRRHTAITLVHAVTETPPTAAKLPYYSLESFIEVGQRIVGGAKKLVLESDPDIQVSTSVQAGSRVKILVAAGDQGSVIVLGHRSRSLTGRIVASSTTTGVAARAHCPVISVPESWVTNEERGTLVVGVDKPEAAHQVLDIAFREARRRSASLVVLNAWKLPTAYEDLEASVAAVEDWRKYTSESMDNALAPFRERYPGVPLEVDIRYEYPGPALVNSTKTADLIIVGRRGHGAPWGIYLGSLARLLIRKGRCPVQVVPQHPPEGLEYDERFTVDGEESNL